MAPPFIQEFLCRKDSFKVLRSLWLRDFPLVERGGNLFKEEGGGACSKKRGAFFERGFGGVVVVVVVAVAVAVAVAAGGGGGGVVRVVRLLEE